MSTPPPTNDQLFTHSSRQFSRYGLNHSVYGVPVDAIERERETLLDGVIRHVVGGQSLLVPLRDATPRRDGRSRETATDLPRVLDCGCGSGVWIERLLEERNYAVDIVGVDICHKQGLTDDDVDDSEEEDEDNDDDRGAFEKYRWNLNIPVSRDRSDDRLTPETFDAIQSRCVADGIDAARWRSYVGEVRGLLKRGGWVQMVEILPHIQSNNGRLPDDSFLTSWWLQYQGITERMGKNVRIGRELERMLTREGFDRVQGRAFDVPIGGWAGQVAIGMRNREFMARTLEALTLWPLTQSPYGRMPLAQYRQLIAGARQELQDDRMQLYYKLSVGPIPSDEPG